MASTPNHRTDADLVASVESCRQLVESMPDTVVVYDRGARVLYVNHPPQGLDHREVIGRSAYAFIPPEAHDDFRHALDHVFMTGRTHEFETVGDGPQGSVAWYRTRMGALVRDGRVIAATSVTTDITRRRTAEEELQRAHDRLEAHVSVRTQELSAANLELRKQVAERSLAQAALRVSEERYRRMVETAHEGVATIDKRERITFVNRRFAEMLDYAPEELIGRSGWDFLVPEQHAEAEVALERRREGVPDQMDLRLIRKDGKPIWVMVSSTPLSDRDGEYDGTLALITDITERKRAEEELRASEQKLAAAQAVAHLGSWEWDIQGDVVTWSDELYRIFALEPHEFGASFEGFLERVHPDDREPVRRTVERALAKRADFRFDERIVRPDGEIRVLESRGEVQTGADGEPVRMVGTCQDVTELRLAEEAVREVETRFRHAFDHAPIGKALVSVDPDRPGRLLEVNRALCELTGYSEEDLRGKTFPDLTHPDDRESDGFQLGELLSGEVDAYSVERRLVHAGGHEIWTLVSVSVMRRDDGEPSYGIVQIQDMSERKRFEGQLQHLADHDALTGLTNRRRFEEDLRRQVAYNQRYGGQGAVLVVDLDRFKYVNDSLGHAMGDELISRVAGLIRDRLRATDVVARLGGDEFGVLLPRVEEEEACALAEKLLDAIHTQSVLPTGARPLHLTASIGISFFSREDEVAGETPLVNADIAMYQAKEDGRNQYAVVHPRDEPQVHMRMRLSWSERIRDALENDRFVLHAQPIVDLRSGEVSRHELLLRMEAPDGDVIPPGAFLPVAEDFGMIQAIDGWVARRAVGLIADAKSAGRDLRLEVNLSGVSITDEGVLRVIEEEVGSSGIDPRSLVFEVTETAAIVNIEKAKRFAGRLAELGCRFALDDFGAGFGSFYYLKHLPFDYLKIDGDFIRNLPASKSNQLTVKAIVQIAQGLKKKTIAEFVEHEATVRLLRLYGVDFGQGYHLGMPAPVEEALANGGPPEAANDEVAEADERDGTSASR